MATPDDIPEFGPGGPLGAERGARKCPERAPSAEPQVAAAACLRA